MTQYEHTLLAGFIVMIIYQIMWHTFLKHHPVTKKNIQEYFEIFKNLF
jgi:hypothetical protein